MNKIKGGKADKLTVKDIADKFNVSVSEIEKQLRMGVKVEHEHTNDKSKAKEIAMDHLSEMPDYYTRLEKMEKEAIKAAKKKETMSESKLIIKRLLRENLAPLFSEEYFKARVPFFKDFKFFKHPRYDSRVEAQRVIYHENIKKVFDGEIYVFPQFNVSSDFVFDIHKINDLTFYQFSLTNKFHISKPSNMDDLTFKVLVMAQNQMDAKLSIKKEIMVKEGEQINKAEVDKLINDLNEVMFKMEEISNKNNTPLY